MSSHRAPSSCDSAASDPRPQYHVFLSHAGQQKRNVVDHVRDRFIRDHPQLNVFVDEHTLEPGDRAMDCIWGACERACVGEAPIPYGTFMLVNPERHVTQQTVACAQFWALGDRRSCLGFDVRICQSSMAHSTVLLSGPDTLPAPTQGWSSCPGSLCARSTPCRSCASCCSAGRPVKWSWCPCCTG
jgi:hypothetical protein